MKKIMIGRNIVIFFTLFSSMVFSSENQIFDGYTQISEEEPLPPKNFTCFALITIPNSGFSILLEALYALTQREAIWHTRFPSSYYIPPEEGFLHTHFCLSPDLESDYASLPKLKQIILIRDFRDVA